MRNAVRFLASLLALVAVSVVLARPICDLDHVLGNASQQQDCCASLEDGMHAAPKSVAAPLAKPPSAALLAGNWSSPWRPAPRLLAADFVPDRLPIPQPYHSRSARILS